MQEKILQGSNDKKQISYICVYISFCKNEEKYPILLNVKCSWTGNRNKATS